MRSGIGAAVGLALMALVSGIPSGSVATEAPCAPVVELPGIGPACREGPLWRLLLPDGRSVLTHGPDPVPEVATEIVDTPWLGGLTVPPACTAGTNDTYRNVLVYARAFDAPDRYAEMAPQVRDMAVYSNTLLFRETTARYKVLCEGQEMVVVNAVLPTSQNADGPGSIFTDLYNAGYRNTHEKYWVWYDGFACWCGGIATIDADSQLLPGNRNNIGPDWALTFGLTGFSGWFVMMHENGHNLGAVQLDTPQASGGFHCNDGWDVMCYADGGPTSNYNHFVCNAMWPDDMPHWDCNKDDYAALVPGSEYLATHWNMASAINRFVTHAV